MGRRNKNPEANQRDKPQTSSGSSESSNSAAGNHHETNPTESTSSEPECRQDTSPPAVPGPARRRSPKVHPVTGNQFAHYCDKPGCNYGTDRKNNLTRHNKSMHTAREDKVYECCNILFKLKGNYRLHIKTDHKKGFQCHMCPHKFDRKALLKRHFSVHTGIKPYKCKNCNYSTSHKSNLTRHCEKKNHDYKKSQNDDKNDKNNVAKKPEEAEANGLSKRANSVSPTISSPTSLLKLSSPSCSSSNSSEACPDEPLDLSLAPEDKEKILKLGARKYWMHRNNVECNSELNSKLNSPKAKCETFPNPESATSSIDCLATVASYQPKMPVPINGTSTSTFNNNINHHPTRPQQHLLQGFPEQNNPCHSPMPKCGNANVIIDPRQQNMYFPHSTFPGNYSHWMPPQAPYVPQNFFPQPQPNGYPFLPPLEAVLPNFQQGFSVPFAARPELVYHSTSPIIHRGYFTCLRCKGSFPSPEEFQVHCQKCANAYNIRVSAALEIVDIKMEEMQDDDDNNEASTKIKE